MRIHAIVMRLTPKVDLGSLRHAFLSQCSSRVEGFWPHCIVTKLRNNEIMYCVKITILWDSSPCGLVTRNRRSRRIYCLHLARRWRQVFLRRVVCYLLIYWSHSRVCTLILNIRTTVASHLWLGLPIMFSAGAGGWQLTGQVQCFSLHIVHLSSYFGKRVNFG
jgi:hypothetical protein